MIMKEIKCSVFNVIVFLVEMDYQAHLESNNVNVL